MKKLIVYDTETDEFYMIEPPRKRDTVVRWVSQTLGNILITHEPTDYDRGWNDCRAYFMGEVYGKENLLQHK